MHACYLGGPFLELEVDVEVPSPTTDDDVEEISKASE
jgi:hypothetical protein